MCLRVCIFVSRAKISIREAVSGGGKTGKMKLGTRIHTGGGSEGKHPTASVICISGRRYWQEERRSMTSQEGGENVASATIRS